jgi:hypothetical protein
MMHDSAADKRVRAGLDLGSDGKPKAFVLSHGSEKTVLLPGRAWTKTDNFKWAQRGLIEDPQSFHVTAEGTVEINGARILLDDPEGAQKLEEEINKRRAIAPVGPKAQGPAGPVRPPEAIASEQLGKTVFRVRLDHVGHLMIECYRGQEKAETGLKGINMLVQNGFLLPLHQVHLDPLQRGLELDGTWFDATEVGAQLLQKRLNEHYAPALKAEEEHAVSIRDNPASATGFDIHFVTVHAGARMEVKGHLAQERLDILTDQTKCNLLNPGILVRLSPPNLLVRRRRPDGGEEKVTELPDLNYRKSSAQQIQHLLNHPLVRRLSGKAAAAYLAKTASGSAPTSLLAPPIAAALPEPTRPLPSAQAVSAAPPAAPPLPPPASPVPPPSAGSSTVRSPARGADDLRPANMPDAESVVITPGGTTVLRRAELAPVVAPPTPTPASEKTEEVGPFREADSLSIIQEIFRRLGDELEMHELDIRLSLPKIFENRRFEILSLSHPHIESVLELRSEEFYGFYLSHLSDQNILLVYARAGWHIEWGSTRCELQPGPAADPYEFKGSALLGLGQDSEGNFLFVVTPAYKHWVRAHEKAALAAHARFLTPAEFLGATPPHRLIWPEVSGN